MLRGKNTNRIWKHTTKTQSPRMVVEITISNEKSKIIFLNDKINNFIRNDK